MMSNDDLIAALTRYGHTAARIPGPCGGSILAVNAAARVLRLTGPSGHEFLWLNPALDTGQAGDLFEGGGWRNLGGDRTFIAPESDFYVRDLSRPWDTFFVPIEIDPGGYALRRRRNEIRLRGSICVTNCRLGVRADIEISKTVRPAANPFRLAAGSSRDLAAVEYVGFEQEATIRLRQEPAAGLRVGLWHLTQVRAPGAIVIPVTDNVPPRDYLSPTGADRLRVAPGMIRFSVDATSMHKIGVKAASCIGRVGFLRSELDGRWSLLIRNCLVNPSAEYVDAPWDDLDDSGYALQCYNDSGELGDFGEMEYHSPAVGDGTGLTAHTDISQLWGFVGGREQIERIGERLLGIRQCTRTRADGG